MKTGRRPRTGPEAGLKPASTKQRCGGAHFHSNDTGEGVTRGSAFRVARASCQQALGQRSSLFRRGGLRSTADRSKRADHQRRGTPYLSNVNSFDMMARFRACAWAMIILSKGSSRGPRRAPARAASSTVMGSSAKPWRAIALGISSARTSASGSLPLRCFVAISHAVVALMSTSLSSSDMDWRVGRDNRSLPANHQRNA